MRRMWILWSAVVLAALALPVQAQWTLLEELDVEAQIPTGITSSVTLEAGKNYQFEVSGTYKPAGSWEADAEYGNKNDTTWDDIPQVVNPANRVDQYLELWVNDANVEWGDSFNPDHVYTLDFVGLDSTVDFHIYEQSTNYGDNTGSLHVKIYQEQTLPFGSTHEARIIKADSAYLSGCLLDAGALDCQCRYYYWAEGGPVNTTEWTSISFVNFTLVEGLTPNTVYTCQLEIRNDLGTDLDETKKSFVTQSRIAISSTEGGSVVDPTQTSIAADAGTVININAVTDDGYVFVGWSGSAVDAGLVADADTAATTVEITGDLTLVANFLPLYTVAISSTDNGYVSYPGEGSFEMLSGTILDIIAIEEETGTFTGWTGSAVDAGLVADPNAASTTVEVTADATLVAEFAAKPKIVWVTETTDIDSDGIRDDQDWVDLLTNSGYYVEVQPDRYTAIGDEKDVNDANDYLAELNDADLVVISRSASSGNYDDDANEIANWNSVMSPMISLSAYHIRNSRLKWIDSSSAVNDNSMPLMAVEDANHAIFAGVESESGIITLVDSEIFGEDYQGTTFVEAADMGNATVLGSHLMGYPWIAEWTPGDEYYDGAGQIAGGKRMMFMAGTQETKENDIYYPQGAMNLTDAGVQVFLNAVEYMISFNPVDPGTDSMTHLYTFEDGTADDLVGDANGTLVGDANNVYIADGALVTTAQDVWMSMPGDVIDINSYEAATIECWYTPEAGANTSWSMLAYLGSNEGGAGQDGWFITSARADDKCRAAISTGSTSPWADESGVDRTGNIDDGLLHHMVSTLDADEITFYIDGVFIGSTPLADADNSLSELSNSLVYLAKGGYDSDPEWIGQIQKFAIYNKVLSENEALYLYLAGE